MKKLYLQLYLHGALGIVKRFFKCLKENGVSYTIKQLFKGIDEKKEMEIEKSISLIPTESSPSQIKKIEPRPSGLYKYPPTSLEKIIELRVKSQNLKGIIVQAHAIDWEVPLYQRPQHMAIAMAKSGYLVFYLSTNYYDMVDGFTEVYRNLFIASDLNLCSKIKNATIIVYSTSTSLPLEQFKSIRKNNMIFYDYIDHIDPKISGDKVEALMKQFNYIKDETIDFVVCSGKRLMTDFDKKVNPSKIAYIPNGVEFEHFEYALDISDPDILPPAFREIINRNRPVVGYYGAIAPWLCYDILKDTMELLPDFEFVFIGPDYNGGAQNLPKLPNCHLLGIVDYKVLPTYANHFHVAIIPFAPGQIAQTTSPLKLFEYFALQKPVVVTKDMTECIAFKEVLFAADAKEFAKKIQEAYLLGQDEKFKKRLKEIALENTWEKRAEIMDNMISRTKLQAKKGSLKNE